MTTTLIYMHCIAFHSNYLAVIQLIDPTIQNASVASNKRCHKLKLYLYCVHDKCLII